MVGSIVSEGAMRAEVMVVAGRIRRTSSCAPLCWQWGAWWNALVIFSLLAVEAVLGAFRDLLILDSGVDSVESSVVVGHYPLCTCSSLVGDVWVQ